MGNNEDQFESAVQTHDLADNAYALSDVCVHVTPVWTQQIESARQITDNAIQDISKRFYGLSQRIQYTATSQTERNVVLQTLLSKSQTELTQVIQMLKTSMQQKQMLVNMILALKASAKELSEHATNSNTLTSEKVDAFSKAIDATELLSSEFTEVDSEPTLNAIKMVEQTIDNFGDAAKKITDSSEHMRGESQSLRDEISNVLVSLQFQDRVTQMLSHVQNDLKKLNETISNGDSLADAEHWLQALAATYTMQEEHSTQAEVTKVYTQKTQSATNPATNTNSITIKPTENNNSNEITFFNN